MNSDGIADRVRLIHADCRDAIKTLADNSVDSCVVDGPYALVSIVKRFGKEGAAPCKEGTDGVYRRASAGFMGKVWDTGEVYFDPEFWREVMRVLKPGAHVAAFAGTRTYHRLACAIEDAGFEIRDQLAWVYGSGFPKSHDVSKGIDKALGKERAKVRIEATNFRNPKSINGGDGIDGGDRPWLRAARESGFHEAVSDEAVSDEAVSDEAVEWRGWGSALKPAWEPICLARKPLTGTVAANVLEFGTGAINIDGCRVATEENLNGGAYAKNGNRAVSSSLHAGSGMNQPGKTTGRDFTQPKGRWPANIIHDGSDEVLASFPDAPGQQQGINPQAPSPKTGNIYGKMNREGEASADRRYTDNGSTNFAALPGQRRNDSGSAARFFYQAKADADDRLGSKHPTVKPIALMRWLVRLVTPLGGVVLDPFAGTGSTGIAAAAEGMHAILVEREDEYAEDIRRRLDYIAGRAPIKDAMKSRNKQSSAPLPLFSVAP